MAQFDCCQIRLETCGRIVAIVDSVKCLLYIGSYFYVLDNVPAIVTSLGKDKAELDELLLLTKSIYIVLYVAIVSNANMILAALILIMATYWYSYKMVLPWIIFNFSNLVYFIIVLTLLRNTPRNQLIEFKSSAASFGYLITIIFSIITNFLMIQLFKSLRNQAIIVE